ncbi:MAG: hypothetical protein BM555_01940 [Crocinitomix sp. MedPE-SWsnd]|jgi:hypothetical protein|nr:MAG: hypothetical protein BM555_01940 [Crocinitomix sp. MedPE-SWsnd]
MRVLIAIILIFTNVSLFSQEADLSDLEDVRDHLTRTRWEADSESDSGAEFLLIFSDNTDKHQGTIIGSNVPNNALSFELILDNEKAHILWYNSSERCISTEVISASFNKLVLEVRNMVITFNRKIWFITGCPSF